MGLGKWFEDNGFGVIGQIVPMVVVPHTTTIDRKTVKHDRNVVKADMLATWWDEWLEDQTLAWMISNAWRLWRRGIGEECSTSAKRIGSKHEHLFAHIHTSQSRPNLIYGLSTSQSKKSHTQG